MQNDRKEFALGTDKGVYFIRPHIEDTTKYSEYVDEHYLLNSSIIGIFEYQPDKLVVCTQ